MRSRWLRLVVVLVCVCGASGPVPAAADGADARVGEIETLMSAYEAAGTFSGAVLVVETGETIYERAIGCANHDWGLANTMDTRFRIASLTKAFTKVLLLQLVEEGRVDLSGTIADYLPDYAGPGADRITVAQLFDHRSGIVGESAVSNLDRIERDYFTRSRMLELIAGYELAAAPGQLWIYSNFGYYLLGAIIEAASGRTYNELLQERICVPAGMHDTLPDGTTQLIERRASGHFLDSSGVLTLDVPLDMSFVFAYGDLLSTPRDLYLFYRALLDGRLVNEAHRRIVYDNEAEHRPIGDGSRVAYVYEDGPASVNGFRAGIYNYPREERFVIVLMNVRGSGAALVYEVGRNIAAVLYGAPYALPSPLL